MRRNLIRKESKMAKRFYTTATFLVVLVSLMFAASTAFACGDDKKKEPSDDTSQES